MESGTLSAGQWPVFPVVPGTKRPYAGSRGVLDATTDPDRIEWWWEIEYPDASVGGACTGKLVLDLDLYADPAAKRWWLEHQKWLPLTQVHGRGDRSRHLVYLCDQPGPWRRELERGVEIKAGPSAYVLLPPSVHPSGERYEVRDPRPPVAAPRWLVEAARRSDEAVPALAGVPVAELVQRLTVCELAAFQRPGNGDRSDHTFHVAVVSFGCGRTPGQVASVLELDEVTQERWLEDAGKRDRELPRLLAQAKAAARPCRMTHRIR
jgi:hypothetical protein